MLQIYKDVHLQEKNRAEIEKNIVEAIKFHIELLEEGGLPIPLPSSDSEMLVFA